MGASLLARGLDPGCCRKIAEAHLAQKLLLFAAVDAVLFDISKARNINKMEQVQQTFTKVKTGPEHIKYKRLRE